MSTTPTLEQLQRALAISEQIAALEAEMKAIFVSPSAPIAKSAAVRGKTFTRSPETIAKMKASQQARWAKVKGKKAATAPKDPAKAMTETPVKKKSKMSAQGLANIKAAQKKRWAKIKAARKAPAKASSEPKKAQASTTKKPTMSAEAKAKLSALMKAKWAAKQAAKAPAATETKVE